MPMQYDDKFKQCFILILADEGGWVFTDDANDPGDMTYGGLTFEKYYEWFLKTESNKFPKKLMQTSFRSQATMNDSFLQQDITICYYNEFWKKARCDEMPYEIDELMFSIVTNLGVRQGVKILQRACNERSLGQLKVDGIIGELTVRLVNHLADSYDNFIQDIINAWEDKYIDLVVKNAEAWRNWGMSHTIEKLGSEFTAMPTTITMQNAPSSFRAKYLRGWINRTRKYEKRYL